MGLIISRFRRKKATTDILERLETEIRSIEEDGQCKEQTHKRVISYFMVYSMSFYFLSLVLCYLYMGRNQHWLNWVLGFTLVVIVPVIVMYLRSTISWYYKWSLGKNKEKLKKLKEEKLKILRNVMNTETYCVAKKILDEFGNPEEPSKETRPIVPLNAPGTPVKSPVTSPAQVRQRLPIANSPALNNNNSIVPVTSTMAVYKGPRLRSEQLPRPLPDRNRSALDKVVDYILKDGPNHRMALICSACYSHNGMSMAEEFDFVSYICAYCGHMNAARKQKPAAPLLSPMRALPPIPRRPMDECGDDTPTASSGSDSEAENKNEDAVTETGEEEPDRPPSPAEGETKTEQEKKED